MTRTALLYCSLFATACTVGQIPEGGVSDAAGNGCITRNAAPDASHLHLAGGTPNAGMSCVTSLCHLAGALGPDAPAWQFAGTVYKTGGTLPNPGVTVTFKRVSDGMAVTAITDVDGNFHVPDGMLPDAFPSTVTATACPTLTPMVGQLQVAQSGGDCNAGGTCHGGTQGKVTLADQ